MTLSLEEMVQHQVSYLTTVLSLTNMQQQATTIFTSAPTTSGRCATVSVVHRMPFGRDEE